MNLFVSYVIQYGFHKKSNIITADKGEVERDTVYLNEMVEKIPDVSIKSIRMLERQLNAAFMKSQSEFGNEIVLSSCKILFFQKMDEGAVN